MIMSFTFVRPRRAERHLDMAGGHKPAHEVGLESTQSIALILACEKRLGLQSIILCNAPYAAGRGGLVPLGGGFAPKSLITSARNVFAFAREHQ